MKVVICGAGQVGSTIAAYLSEEGNKVTLVDESPDTIQRVTDMLDVAGVVGCASHPDVLAQAGAMDADMLVAATYSDEVNMVSCQVAHSLFNVPKKIARVRHQSYLDHKWQNLYDRDHLPIDVVISPEVEVAKAIANRLRVPGAFNIIPMVEGRVQLVSVVCKPNCPLINTPLKHLTNLFPDIAVEVVAIIRGESNIIPSGMESMRVGDEVYFVCATEHLQRIMSAFGFEMFSTRKVLIVGAGKIGVRLAEELTTNYKDISVRMIEADLRKAQAAAEKMPTITVLNGNAMEQEKLREAGVGSSEAVIAVMNSDESNILVSMLAKQQGCDQAIALVNGQSFTALVSNLGVDAIINPRVITISTILQHVRRGRIKAAHALRDGFAEILEVEALDSSGVINTPLREVRRSKGIIFGLIVRGEKIIVPQPDTVIRPDDRVVILAEHSQVKTVEAMFSVRPEFF